MSKGTIRFPESVVAGGRVGTARIREEIAGAAARLACAEAAPLESTVKRLISATYDLTVTAVAAAVGRQTGQTAAEVVQAWSAVQYPSASSPLERMQQLGRLGTGRMNKTEQAYDQVLAARLHAGEILWYRFEAHKLRLADNTFYTPDFAVITATHQLEFHEVKGHWTDKARAKTKVAAAQYPHRFIAIRRDGRHGWHVEDLTSISW